MTKDPTDEELIMACRRVVAAADLVKLMRESGMHSAAGHMALATFLKSLRAMGGPNR